MQFDPASAVELRRTAPGRSAHGNPATSMKSTSDRRLPFEQARAHKRLHTRMLCGVAALGLLPLYLRPLTPLPTLPPLGGDHAFAREL